MIAKIVNGKIIEIPVSMVRSSGLFTPQEEYNIYTGVVQNGFLEYAREAKDVALGHGLSLQLLEESLTIGRQKLFNKLVSWISNDDDTICSPESPYVEQARKLVIEYGFSLHSLEEARMVRRQKMFEKYVSLVRDGQITYAKEARELIVEHGFPLQALEDALPIGIAIEKQRVFEAYKHKIEKIREGGEHINLYEYSARTLAAEHNFPLKELEDALKTGR